MTDVTIAAGTGTGPTTVAAYDAALVDVGIADFNLVGLSSVVPGDATIDRVERIEVDGNAGDILTVVEARATARQPATAVAGLGWRRSESGPGLFHEASASGPDATEAAVRSTIETGLDHGMTLRSWTTTSGDSLVVSRAGIDAGVACAVVVATIGRPRPP